MTESPASMTVGTFWRAARGVERTAYAVGVVLLTSGLLHLAVLVLGGGSWNGPLSLRKPATFGLSFALTLVTIAWVSSYLRFTDLTRARLLNVFTGACVLETALVTLQAWRGVPSHFNLETTFDGLVARMLAAGGVTLVAIIAILTIASFRPHAAVAPSLRVAIRVGFVILSGSMVIGALMIARGMGLVFAGDPQRAYATGGAFKPAHGVMMHAILVLPFLAWLLSFSKWTERRRVEIVLLASAGYGLLAGTTAVMNLADVELGHWPAAAIATAAVGLAFVIGAGIAGALASWR